jgi:oxygen-independent coproporphyrinogen-3 oxidase
METECLPDEDKEYQLYKMTQHVLQSHGYEQYEISNYAKAGYECEHNIVYWIRKPYLGLGLGAASLVGSYRGSNVKDIYEYMKRCEDLTAGQKNAENPTVIWQGKTIAVPLWETSQQLSRSEEMEEFMFLGLRRNQGVLRSDFEQNFGCNIDGIYGPQLKKLREEEMLRTEEGRIFLTERGMDLSNYVLAQFLLGE